MKGWGELVGGIVVSAAVAVFVALAAAGYLLQGCL
jgi:hypothetical protein